MKNKYLWITFFASNTLALYFFCKIAFASPIVNFVTENPNNNPWIPVILAVVGLTSAILAFLREKKNKP